MQIFLYHFGSSIFFYMQLLIISFFWKISQQDVLRKKNCEFKFLIFCCTEFELSNMVSTISETISCLFFGKTFFKFCMFKNCELKKLTKQMVEFCCFQISFIISGKFLLQKCFYFFGFKKTPPGRFVAYAPTKNDLWK